MEWTKEQCEKLQEELLYKNKPAFEENPGDAQAVQAFCEGYKAFLDAAKTEREAVAYFEEKLLAAGYTRFVPGKKYRAGDKIYLVNRQKSLLAATIGTRSLEEGFHLNVSHIDSPRLDLRPVPVYEAGDFSLLKTHYYGGVRKYQWATIPLAIHGVVYKADGEQVRICIGEAENDPVFCVTDLLPHVAAAQNGRTLGEGISGEELNILFGSQPIGDENVKEGIKLNALRLLHEKYGIVERDLVRAEIEIVPAFKAKDVGLDRSMIGAYGHDDRVDAYTAMLAEMEVQAPALTSVCVVSDKEEIGSEGVTGMNSLYVFHFLQQLCAGQGADYINACKAAKCLSADVTSAFDPTWADAFEKSTVCHAGRGVGIFKYTGARGKSGGSDASAEVLAYLVELLDSKGISWQIGEIGKIDNGGGGTVAKYVASQDIDTVDVGVPVLCMHAPFEVVSKYDVYMAYKAFTAFAASEK